MERQSGEREVPQESQENSLYLAGLTSQARSLAVAHLEAHRILNMPLQKKGQILNLADTILIFMLFDDLKTRATL